MMAAAPAPQPPFFARHDDEQQQQQQLFHRNSISSASLHEHQQQQQHPHQQQQLAHEASWFDASPSLLRGNRTIPQTPSSTTTTSTGTRRLTNDTPGLSPSASNTPAGPSHDMPWTPVQPNFTRPLHHHPHQLPAQHLIEDSQNKGLHMLDIHLGPSAGLLPNHIHPAAGNGGGISMARIASAPLPYHPGLFETPNTSTIDLPPTQSAGPGSLYTPDVYMWQNQDSYFTAPAAAAMGRSMTDIQHPSAAISPMAIMERSLSSSSSMPSLGSSDGGVPNPAGSTPAAVDLFHPGCTAGSGLTPSSVGAGRTPRRRQRRPRDPPGVSAEQNKPHPCPICNTRFIRLEHLKRHLRTHSKERPHVCSFPGCTKAFGRTDNRDQHVKTHFKGQHQLKNGFTQLMALTKGEDGSRNDPHNAARSSAFAAIEAARSSRRVVGLERPIALVQPGSGSPSRNYAPPAFVGRGANAGTGALVATGLARTENDENNVPAAGGSPASPGKLGLLVERQNSFDGSNGGELPSTPPLRLKTQADLNIVRLHPQQPRFQPSFQHHFGDTSVPAGGPLSVATPLLNASGGGTGTASGISSSSSGSGTPHFMPGQPLLYTISENELQFVASSSSSSSGHGHGGAGAGGHHHGTGYPLTPSLSHGNGGGPEPPFLHSPSALGLSAHQPSPAGGMRSHGGMPAGFVASAAFTA